MNQIINGDCLKVLPTLPDNSVDLVVTDPPYGIDTGGVAAKSYTKSGNNLGKRKDYSKLYTGWDSKPLSPEVWAEIKRVSKNQILFGANYYSDMLPPSKCWVVWDKRGSDKYHNDFADCELAWTSFDKPAKMIRYLWMGCFQQDMKSKEQRYHPTQKPVAVMRQIIEMFSKEGDLILDPFVGSGSTLIACQQLQRRWMGIEINPEYCAIAQKRVDEASKQTVLL